MHRHPPQTRHIPAFEHATGGDRARRLAAARHGTLRHGPAAFRRDDFQPLDAPELIVAGSTYGGTYATGGRHCTSNTVTRGEEA